MFCKLSNILSKVRSETPLVHCITNYVTINDCANILLAYGASPAMVESIDESYDFAKISSCIYINIGTLTKEQEESMLLATIAAKKYNIPVVLDPVGCSAINHKIQFINKLFEVGKIDVIKGNLSEIKALGGFISKARGVDSIDTCSDKITPCKALAKKHNCIVVATGIEDIITDGNKVALIKNGTSLLTLITGAGCMVGSLISATCSIEENRFLACVTAVLSMNLASEHAKKSAKAPGSFKVKLIDEIYLLKEEDFESEGNIEWI